jgi:hypothetical protein
LKVAQIGHRLIRILQQQVAICCRITDTSGNLVAGISNTSNKILVSLTASKEPKVYTFAVMSFSDSKWQAFNNQELRGN